MSTTKYIIDNLEEQTIGGDFTIDGNFTVTGTTNTRPYKVFTALLTQSGGDNPYSTDSEGGDLTIGTSYQITANGGTGGDFTNVGAPNNEIGTYFIATGTTPNSWGVDGLLSANSGAPVATVLENTIGNIWFTYEQTGGYVINSDGLFTINKTMSTPIYGDYTSGVSTSPVDINRVGISNTDGINNTSNYVNEIISTPIEIRVYN
jgi:hypothetical protein